MSLKNSSVTIKIPKLLKEKLKNKKILKIYNNFEKSINVKDNFIVGVSGGPDSLALAFLAKIYAIKYNIKPKYFIIDHKLRVESTNEAKIVKSVLSKYLIKANILTWKGSKPSNNIQAKARDKRYKFLFKQCEKYKIKYILLGHQQEDLFENFLIRMLRGSGLKGLVSLDKKTKIGSINLLRPLLYEKKEDLVFVARNVFNFYVKDVSNEDQKYLRVQIRTLFDQFQKRGLNKRKLFNTIKNLKDSNNVVNYYVNENLKKNTYFSKQNKKFIINHKFFEQPHEIIFRALTELIKFIGNKYYSVRGKKIDKIIEDIYNIQSFKATLGGCIIQKVNQTVIISKESINN